ANVGFDVRDGSYTDMIAAGLIDSTKMLRIALQIGASAGASLVTTEAMVGVIPEPEIPAMPSDPMDDFDG
ncbi:MAG: chaperonin GroEL, partial [Rhodospirillales bacterium]|nr:chaperonin GroEL [Rhodospirillales bacterium]